MRVRPKRLQGLHTMNAHLTVANDKLVKHRLLFLFHGDILLYPSSFLNAKQDSDIALLFFTSLLAADRSSADVLLARVFGFRISAVILSLRSLRQLAQISLAKQKSTSSVN